MDHESLILGELREFKRSSIAWMENVENKVDSFQAFRAKIIGVSLATSAFISLIAAFIADWLRH